MKRFEYLSVEINDRAEYNENRGTQKEVNWCSLSWLGKNGWQVVAVHWLGEGGYALMMREVETKVKAAR